MGYVKTADEVSRIRALLGDVSYGLETIGVTFHTEADFVREVLPPCFTPPASPRGLLKIGRSFTEEGGVETALAYGGLYVLARYNDAEGWYQLTEILTGDMPIIVGRELWGEVKRRGEVHFEVDANGARGHVERLGTRIMEVDAKLGPELGPRTGGMCYLHLKAFLDTKGQDLEYPPIVVVDRKTSAISNLREGEGTIQLTSSPTDPCGTVPVFELETAVYERSYSHYTTEAHVLDESDEYLPYVLGRNYNFLEGVR